MTSGSPRLLAVLPGFTPSTLMCVVNPLLRLAKAGQIEFETGLEFYTRLSMLHSANLVVFCRNTDPRYAYLLEALQRRGIPYIFDLDDDLFEVPADTSLGQYHRRPEHLAFLTRFLKEASLVRLYSPVLAEKLAPITNKIELVAPPLDWSLVANPLPQRDPSLVRIVYATSREDDHLAQVFLPALEKILARCGSKVELHFLGPLPASLRGHPQVHQVKFTADYNRYLRWFSRQRFEIGLAPMLDDAFHRSKTNNKFREYAACNIAGIYSNTPVYSSCVQDGESGLLVENTPEAWENAILRLVEDTPLRRRIAAAAREYARAHYSEELFTSIWLEQIHRLSASPALPGGTRKAVPVTNIPTGPGGKPIAPPPGIRAWLTQKVKLVIERVKASGVAGLFAIIKLQAVNLWLLYKINVLKKL